MDDGRFNKVANIVGQTMQYHPHGDASISAAIVNIGQKNLLIETQGNWGDERTGDNAAASRYIEARLSKFALDISFNHKITNWQLSYDGRKNEPINLPMKFPLLLAQGAEGIAVGLSTKILPHNFCELIEASILYLKNKKFTLVPDFETGGYIDASNYQDGMRGGKIKVRAKVEELDKKTIVIKSVPFGVTTSQLADSILKANDSGKLKIKSVTDNTAAEVELHVNLAAGVSTDQMIDALYAFTDCETSISPNACVIIEEKPHFVGVSELLKRATDHTKQLLLLELQIKLKELEEDWHFSSLEKIFIEKRIYRNIEEETTWEGVLRVIDKGLTPYKKLFKRDISEEDIIKLTEIKIKRISKFDAFKADELLNKITNNILETKNNIEQINEFTIRYYEDILKKYGKGKERKTELRLFENIEVNNIAIANTKLYINRKEGFIGTSLKKDEYLFDCSDLDLIIVFLKDARMQICKVADKIFIGKDIIHAEIFRKTDERTTYNMIYLDGKSAIAYGKRFNVTGITRDKMYDLSKGNQGSKVLYFSSNPNGEAEVVSIQLSPGSKARIKSLDFFFEQLDIKGRSAGGNQITKYPIKSIKIKEKGRSTLSAIKLWYDNNTGRLNKDENGIALGHFSEDDKIIAFYKDGTYELTDYELTNRYESSDTLLIEKFYPNNPITAIYYDALTKQYYCKRFLIETLTLKNKFTFIKEGKGNALIIVSTQDEPEVIVRSGKKKSEWIEEKVLLSELVDITGWKSIGKKILISDIKEVVLIPSDESKAESPTLF